MKGAADFGPPPFFFRRFADCVAVATLPRTKRAPTCEAEPSRAETGPAKGQPKVMKSANARPEGSRISEVLRMASPCAAKAA